MLLPMKVVEDLSDIERAVMYIEGGYTVQVKFVLDR